ncbi:WD repeat-containing protein 43-like isoform X2 [Chenopodium quinoa]|uniref:WD repeat-containing protein 43-like isoform X2 n=1 Tax=Chenopodium quinoa TaxID=63459 RepID=UPI000B79826D|nr:WD repeat-containing protein 43-like isoform X2 [Chenopodium quinoa]
MGSSNIKDILTCFSPSLDFFAVTSGDGRIKIWDTLKGQLQTEFSDIVSSEETNLLTKPENRGHLSIDYTCMKWVTFEKKKKRKLDTSFLVLGTGSGDVLALDVSAGQLKWKINDCHPGGVTAIAFASRRSCLYTSGADGMVCELDPTTGNLLRNFKASTKAVSSLSVSPDGKTIVTAASQMKIFGSDHKKIQKFTGHPGAVRCMTLSKDGKYVFSSAVGERYVAVWQVDGSKKQSASCALAMEHPSVYLDCRYDDADGAGFYVLAISEVGVCYFWCGKAIEELRKAKPARISFSVEDTYDKNNKGVSAAIYAANIQSTADPTAISIFLAHGFLIKPSFEKIMVHHGEDLQLNTTRNGLLLPLSQSRKTKKQMDLQTGATTLDRANAEGALLPVPKVLDHYRIKQDQSFKLDNSQAVSTVTKGVDATACPMENRLKTLGIISDLDVPTAKSTRASSLLKEIDIGTTVPPKKMRAAILSMQPSDASKILNVFVDMWQSRSCSGKYVLPWIYNTLVHHGHHILSQEPENATIASLYKIAKSKGSATQSLLQLSGRLQLVTAQIDKATQLKTQPSLPENEMIESEDEEEDENVDEVMFGEEDDESASSSEENND